MPSLTILEHYPRALPQFDQRRWPERHSGIVCRARKLKVAGRGDQLIPVGSDLEDSGNSDPFAESNKQRT
jgi:hypothetical protein